MRLTHKYQTKWDAVIGEVREAKMEPTNNIEKYPVAVCKKGDIVGYLPKVKTEIFAKMIF